jgi:hypothetical protein
MTAVPKSITYANQGQSKRRLPIGRPTLERELPGVCWMTPRQA